MQTSMNCDKSCPHFILLKRIAVLEAENTLLRNAIVASAVAHALKPNHTSQGQ